MLSNRGTFVAECRGLE